LDLFGNIDTFNKNTFLSSSGIGIGLSSSYKLAKALGGTLEITSAKKVGTSVEVIITAYSIERCEWKLRDS
jgi:signal transduction histidine kinase